MSKIVEFITELIGWLQIVLSPFLLALFLGAVLYFSLDNTLGLVSGLVVASLGLIIGVVFATRTWKKKGTVKFLSNISATPELDNSKENSSQN